MIQNKKNTVNFSEIHICFSIFLNVIRIFQEYYKKILIKEIYYIMRNYAAFYIQKKKELFGSK